MTPARSRPFLARGRDGTVLMSWLERRAPGHALRWSRLAAGRWSDPGTFVEAPSFFVNPDGAGVPAPLSVPVTGPA
ncbi:MAG: hypothetical protein PVH00_09640 [Gemmatimonadota bacterium]|jgi:hypothetical protein